MTMAMFEWKIGRRGLWALAGSAALPCARQARAETYPSRSVQLVMPYPAGGTGDIIARFVAEKLRQAEGQPFVVDNRAGATGTIGANYVAQAQPDGYTLLIGLGGPLTIAPALNPNVPYRTLEAFEPITLIAEVPSILAVHPSVPARTVQELVGLAKARPGALNFASAGAGSSVHLAAELFKLQAGIDTVHVPYKGGAPALNDLIAGNVTYMIENMPQLLPQVQAGKIRALAVTSARRSPFLPDVPTVAESGYPGYEATTWFGMLGPKGLPAGVRQRLYADTAAILATEEAKAFFTRQGATTVGNTPAEFESFIRRDQERWAEVIQKAQIKLD
jgi:tripartite-type tricarboxylate transporter receptor subunit TctC